MRKGSKKLLFFTICLFFAVITPAVIFYCLGYRFDFENRAVVQTGGLFLKASPPGVTIYLEQKLYKKTNFFFENAFLGSLLPDSYEVTIKKPNYHSWTKILTVNEKKVTEAKNIILFPENPKFSPLAEEIEGFFPAPDGKMLILKTENEKGWALSSFNLQTKEQVEILNEEELQLLALDIRVVGLSWSPDSKKILIELAVKGQKQYLVSRAAPETNLFILDSEINLKKVFLNPNNPEELFFIAPEETEESPKQVIWRLQANGKQVMLNISAVSKQDIISYLVLNDNILWLTNAGFLYRGRLINSDKIELIEILNLKPLAIRQEANYQIAAANLSKVLLKEDESLYYLNPETHLFEQIFSAAKAVEFSQDMKKIIVSSGNQLWLYFLEGDAEQPQRQAGDKILLFGSPEEITNLFWLNNYYVIFQIKDSIKIAEIDNRSRVNVIELTTFPQLEIHWQQKQKTLLVLSVGNFYLSNDILK